MCMLSAQRFYVHISRQFGAPLNFVYSVDVRTTTTTTAANAIGNFSWGASMCGLSFSGHTHTHTQGVRVRKTKIILDPQLHIEKSKTNNNQKPYTDAEPASATRNSGGGIGCYHRRRWGALMAASSRLVDQSIAVAAFAPNYGCSEQLVTHETPRTYMCASSIYIFYN